MLLQTIVIFFYYRCYLKIFRRKLKNKHITAGLVIFIDIS